jgi:anaerobic ribonucleoside-triphosphate reductase activating protein
MAVRRELVVSRIAERVGVLGPGLRAAIWVRGCPLRCRGCISPEDLPFEGGTRWPVAVLAERLGGLPDEVSGVTFSGGEPMAQASALAALVRLLRRGRDWSVMSYTGYTVEYLRAHGDAAQRDLLGLLDILVDGPYLEHQHADLLWRASDNQRLHFLTSRHARPAADVSAGLEVEASGPGLSWTGVPPVPGFRAAFEAAMRHEGVPLAVES